MDGWDEWGEGFEHEGESISVTFDEVTLFLNQFYIYTQSPEAYIKLRVFSEDPPVELSLAAAEKVNGFWIMLNEVEKKREELNDE